jgi:homoserine dehydrogenase
MEAQGIAYSDVLKEAQDLGFAEADPSADVDGYDVQSKIAILAKLGFGGVVKPADIPTIGISRMMDSTIKLLGVAKLLKEADDKGNPAEISVFVSPVVVPRKNVIASISGATNLVNVRSSNLMDSAYVGQGAGRFPTANSVVNDIVQLARGEAPVDPFKADKKVVLQTDFQSHFFVRIKISDGVGIIRAIGQLAEEANVSIFSILQSPIVDHHNVEFVVTTDISLLSQVREMCQNIGKLSFVQEEPLFIPIL